MTQAPTAIQPIAMRSLSMAIFLLEDAVPLVPNRTAVGCYGRMTIWIRGVHEDNAVDLSLQPALAEHVVKDRAHRAVASRAGG